MIDKRWGYHNDGAEERVCEHVTAIVYSEHYMGAITPAWWVQFELEGLQCNSEQKENKTIKSAKQAAWKAAKKINKALKGK